MKHMLAVLLLSSTALAQTAKTPIEVRCSPKPDDLVGAQVCTAIRDNIATSPRYTEVATSKNGFELTILTVSVSDHDATALAMVLTYDQYYVSGLVQTCGSQKVSECARGLVSSFDEDITDMQKQAANTRAAK
jgi:hypothetical protein